MSHRRFKNKSQCSPGYTKYSQFTPVIFNHFPYTHITQTFHWKDLTKFNNLYATGIPLLQLSCAYYKNNLLTFTQTVGFPSPDWSPPTQRTFWPVYCF